MAVNNKILAGSIIMLIDNNEAALTVLSEILNPGGCTIIQHETIDNILAVIGEKKPDLIFCRIHWPEPEGYEICRIITTYDSLLPVILFSDSITNSDRKKAYEAGCLDYIVLPFVPIEVITKTGNLFSLHKNAMGTVTSLYSTRDTKPMDKFIKEEILLRTQRLSSLGELLSALVHEIRQPLHGMRLILEGIIYWENRKEHIDEKVKMNLEYLQRVINGIDRIDSVIDNIYKSVKHGNSKHIEPINFNEIINSVLDIFKHKIKYHGIEIVLRLDPGLGTIQFTRLQAEQVVINLLSNAIKALDKVTRKVKQITIVTEDQGEYIFFELSDNGPGIAEDIIKKIFDPFFTTEKETESMGIGLYVIHSILDSFNSTIEVSQKKNKGTTFTIKLIREHID